MVKNTAVVALCIAAGASAFVAPTAFTGAQMQAPRAAHATTSLSMEMSPSLPFINKPKNLDGLIGGVGFDPLALCEWFPVKFMVEAEIKHCRVCMLATVGWIISELVHLPGEAYQASNPMDAVDSVGLGPMLQIFFGIGALEFYFNKGKMTMLDMFDDASRVPGDYGFDPLGVSKDPTKYAKYRLSEIKNGRLAMFAISGLIHQSIATGHAVPFY